MTPAHLLLLCAAAQADVMTLSEVLADVDANSPVVAAAVERVRAARHRADAAGAWGDPFVAVGPDEYTLGTDPPMLRYQISQAIPLPGKLSPRVDVAFAQTRGAEAAVEVARRQLHVAALELFLRARYLDRALEANVTQRKTVDDVVASAEARYVSGGSSAHHDVLIGLAERATLQRDALVFSRERAVLLAQLDELAGRAPGDPQRQLIDDAADGSDIPPSLKDALSAQPELLAARIGVEFAEARRRSAAVAALPDLVVQAMAMQSFMPDEPSNIGAMIGISVPIWFPWKQGPLADAATSDKAAWEVDRRQLELRLRASWEEAHTRLASSEETLALYDEKIGPATTAALESSKAAYASQGAPLSELLAVVRASTTVELERAAAALDVRLARARLANLLSMPSTIVLAPSAPTLFAPAMAGSAMGSMNKAMGADRMRATRLGSGMTPVLDQGGGDGDGAAMGGM